jgi:2,4-diketo-3-deoxy-L-fuconate hydrolase
MTKICRFNENRLGIIEGDIVIEVTEALQVLPSVRWPIPPGDLLVENLNSVIAAAQPLLGHGKRYDIDTVKFLSPVANPSKLIGAPVNYRKHQDEANADGGKNFDLVVYDIDHYGVFLKANSSLIGTGAAIEIAYPDRRTDHELELIAVIGTGGRHITRDRALDHVAGYTLGLDMVIRGKEERSLRKSLDTFSVVGPWLVTRDEIADPNALELMLTINGAVRQKANTADMIFDVQRLIEYASRFYTLYPGDIIFTGTPEGVGPVEVGDSLNCSVEGIGSAIVNVIAAPRQYLAYDASPT